MEIQEQNGKFLVVENGKIIYESQSLGESQGYIDWINRSDAGNTSEDCGCPE
tara:strand:+ start:1307 stop:1462 length:156 start_codon:yes stop_codon:yes gene_type:complete